jgi:hypothetical protein
VSSASTVLRGAGYSAQSGSGSRWHVVAACGEAFMKDELRHVHIFFFTVSGLLDPGIAKCSHNSKPVTVHPVLQVRSSRPPSYSWLCEAD